MDYSPARKAFIVSELIPFSFEGASVRVIDIDGKPWFVATDLCAVLGIANSRDALASLDEDEKGVATTDTPGGVQPVAIVNEPGMYSLILRSRKPEAKTFKRWVTHEVLPEIRKTGAYRLADAQLPPSQPQSYPLDEATAVLRQFFMVPVTSVHELTALLRDAGIFKQRPAPKAAYVEWFWSTGTAWNVRRSHLPHVARKLNETYQAINGAVAELNHPDPVQLILDLGPGGPL